MIFLFQIDMFEYKLQLWPGYITSIRQHEQVIYIMHKQIIINLTISTSNDLGYHVMF
jgi:hypothetical protein